MEYGDSKTAQLYLHNYSANYGRIQFSSDANFFIGGGLYGPDMTISCGDSPMYFNTNGAIRLVIRNDGSVDWGTNRQGYDGSAGGLSFDSNNNATFSAGVKC